MASGSVTTDNVLFKGSLTSGDNLNTMYGTEYNGLYTIGTGVTGAPTTWGFLLIIASGTAMTCQVFIKASTLYVRTRQGSPASWSSWVTYSPTE